MLWEKKMTHYLRDAEYSDDKGTGGGKPPVDMNSFLWVNIPSNNPRCVVCASRAEMNASLVHAFVCRCVQDQYGNPTGFDLVSQARILSLVPEEEKGAHVRITEHIWPSLIAASSF